MTTCYICNTNEKTAEDGMCDACAKRSGTDTHGNIPVSTSPEVKNTIFNCGCLARPVNITAYLIFGFIALSLFMYAKPEYFGAKHWTLLMISSAHMIILALSPLSLTIFLFVDYCQTPKEKRDSSSIWVACILFVFFTIGMIFIPDYIDGMYLNTQLVDAEDKVSQFNSFTCDQIRHLKIYHGLESTYSNGIYTFTGDYDIQIPNWNYERIHIMDKLIQCNIVSEKQMTL